VAISISTACCPKPCGCRGCFLCQGERGRSIGSWRRPFLSHRRTVLHLVSSLSLCCVASVQVFLAKPRSEERRGIYVALGRTLRSRRQPREQYQRACIFSSILGRALLVGWLIAGWFGAASRRFLRGSRLLVGRGRFFRVGTKYGTTRMAAVPGTLFRPLAVVPWLLCCKGIG